MVRRQGVEWGRICDPSSNCLAYALTTQRGRPISETSTFLGTIEAKEFEMHDFVLALVFLALVMSPCVAALTVPLDEDDSK